MIELEFIEKKENNFWLKKKKFKLNLLPKKKLYK